MSPWQRVAKEQALNCVARQQKHPLDECESIMEKPLNERINILRKGKFCYGCLKPMAKDHNAKNCQK